MPEREYTLTPYGVEYVCDACNAGFMQPDADVQLMSLPPQWRHLCTACGAAQLFSVRYPELRWRREPDF